MKINRSRGATLVEAALLIPVFLFLFLSIIYFLFFFTAKVNIERLVQEEVLATTINPELFDDSLACPDTGTCPAIPTGVCDAIFCHRKNLKDKLTGLFSNASGSLFEFPDTADFGGVTLSNPRIILPAPIPTIEEGFETQPIQIRAVFQLGEIFSGIKDLIPPSFESFEVSMARYYEFRVDGVLPITTDCDGNHLGSANFGEGDCGCGANQRISLLPPYGCADCVAAHHLPQPPTGSDLWGRDDIGCYIPPSCDGDLDEGGDYVVVGDIKDDGFYDCQCLPGLFSQSDGNCGCDAPAIPDGNGIYNFNSSNDYATFVNWATSGSGPGWSVNWGLRIDPNDGPVCECSADVTNDMCNDHFEPGIFPAGSDRLVAANGCSCVCAPCPGNVRPQLGFQYDNPSSDQCDCNTGVCTQDFTGADCDICALIPEDCPPGQQLFSDANNCRCACPTPPPNVCNGGGAYDPTTCRCNCYIEGYASTYDGSCFLLPDSGGN